MSSTSDSGNSLTSQQTIIVATSVLGGLVAVMLGFALRSWYRRKHPSPEMLARRAARAATAEATTARRSRPRRNASVRTVPEYTEEAKDEEMVLEKAEVMACERNGSDNSDHQDGHVSIRITDFSDDATIIVPGRSRAGTGLSRLTLRDIDPAPELRVSKYDSRSSDYASSDISPDLSHSSNVTIDASRIVSDLGPYAYGQLAAASTSNVSVGSTLEDSHMGARTSTSWNRSTASLFEAPSYANRNRSQSIDIDRTSDLGHQIVDSISSHSARPVHRPSIDNPASRRESIISLRSLITQNVPQSGKSTDPSAAARRAALHRREISAPLTDTLVHNSYDMPKAGLSTLQASWLGSRDAITRMTAYLRPTPPSFDEIDEEAIPSSGGDPGNAAADAELPVGRDSLTQTTIAIVDSAAVPPASQVLSELQEESRRLSSLVHRASIRRSASSGIPAHLVALPQSGPTTPVSPITPMDWPAGLVRGPSINNNLAASVVRLRKDSSRSQTMQSLAGMTLTPSASRDNSLVVDTIVDCSDEITAATAVTDSPTNLNSEPCGPAGNASSGPSETSNASTGSDS